MKKEITITDVINFDFRELVKLGIYVPNWYSKEHFEEFTERKLTDSQFASLCKYLEDCGMFDIISETVSEWLRDAGDSELIEILNGE